MTSKDNAIIRPIVQKDEEILFGLASLLSPKFIIERPIFGASLGKLTQSEDVYLHGLEVTEGIVGYLLGWSRLAFYSNGPVGWVQEIVVNPDYRRRGIGRLLMNHFENWVALRGGRLVSLATRGATDFYLSLGYAESATYYKKAIQPNPAVQPREIQ